MNIAGILLVIFIVLKLLGLSVVATWSWFWVLSPLWIPIAIYLGILGIAGLGIGSAAGAVALFSRKKR